ncbi:MAG: acetate--CoA ligase family protein [Candidatus Rokuibacteriota bacterium]
MRRSLDAFFRPRSVAVVGASHDPSKVGGSVLANLRAGGFDGRIVAVNATRASVQGLAARRSLLEVEEPVDLAVVAVPAAGVQTVLEQCVARGIPAAIVISAGFREAGAEGREREAKLRAWLAGQPLRVLGPNCLGWIRPAAGLNLTFAPGMPPRGGLGFVSHSGALLTAILDWSRERALGFSLLASLGNQADVTETDVLAALADDDETRVILGYVEGVADGRAFFEALGAAAARKPCVLLKTGRSAEGARAVVSHTGALAGSDDAFDAAVRQAGALRVRSLEELFDVARVLATGRRPRSGRVTIATNGGGLGILATDAARDAGLDVAALDSAVRARLAGVLPAHAALTNPVDLIGDANPERYGAALHALDDPDASCLVMLAPQTATDATGVARAILGATRTWTSPVVAVFAGGPRVRAGAQALDEGGIPCFSFPERAVRALAGVTTLAARRRHAARAPQPPPAVDGAALRAAASALPAGPLGFLDAAPLLRACGIAVLEARAAASPAEAAGVAAAMESAVALKIVSPDISHKSDVGGVVLDLRTPEAVRAAAEAMLARVHAARPRARVGGFMVQRMAPAEGFQLLLGMVRDAQFGPLVVLGFGGIYVEILKDTTTRLAPVDRADAGLMIHELRMAPALEGARGMPAADLDALADTISRFSWLAAGADELAEIEINPLVAGAAGTRALDVRAIRRAQETP